MNLPTQEAMQLEGRQPILEPVLIPRLARKPEFVLIELHASSDRTLLSVLPLHYN